MKYLLDTNICIHMIRKKSAKVIQRVIGFPVGDIGVSSITVAELQFGVQKSQQPDQNQQALEQFLMPLAVMPFDHHAALEYGRIRAELERAGKLIGSLDLLIAAHAMSMHVTLVTNNIREFSRIAQLNVEDWTK